LSFDPKYLKFYEETYRHLPKAPSSPEKHAAYDITKKFVDEYKLQDKKCLEIGSYKGTFQDIVADYTGLDIAESLGQFYHKPYFTVNADGTYPFDDHTFDAVWTHAVFEHVPNLVQSLSELTRVVKVGGVVLFAPAWFCRPWAANGYKVRPYKDFDFWGKLVKASIPIRDHVAFRLTYIFPKRLFRHMLFILGNRYSAIKYKKLKPNYEIRWTSDSDAINSIDPHDAILWFASNGFDCLTHPLHVEAFLVRTGTLIFLKT
jgi:SAM-dependent methyltransferase